MDILVVGTNCIFKPPRTPCRQDNFLGGCKKNLGGLGDLAVKQNIGMIFAKTIVRVEIQ